MEEFIKEVGESIKKYRQELGLTQEELALKGGIERSQLSRIEKGSLLGVTYYTIYKLYDALGFKLCAINEEWQNKIKPFVKWAGGKTQLLKTIIELMPESYNDYYEPFIGGGALFFELQPKSFYINDISKDLMMTYQCFTNKKDYNNLVDLLKEHQNKHNEEYYLKIRSLDRESSYIEKPIFEKAARMIYLNKSCFNGLYRVNSNGYFNVPSGKKKKVKAFDPDNFKRLYDFISNADYHITSIDFEKALETAKENDFVYIDPPYDVFDDKLSFTSYDREKFGKEEQKRLFEVFEDLTMRKVKVMLSNHNTDFIKEMYKSYNSHVVKAKRMINSKGDSRGTVEEVIITNY